MPRRKRPNWSKITVTVSREVAQDIRVEAAKRRVEMGTFVDQAVRNLIRMDQSLNISFLEDANRIFKHTSDLENFLNIVKINLPTDLHNVATPDLFWAEILACQQKLMIPKEWKKAMFIAMKTQKEFHGLPRIYTQEYIDAGWFEI